MKTKNIILFFITTLFVGLSSCNNGEEIDKEWKDANEVKIREIQNNPEYEARSIKGGAGTIYYKVLEAGKGTVTPFFTSQVKVNSKGKLINENVFEEKTHQEYYVNSRVPGLAMALQYMKEGDKWEVYVPWQLGHGNNDFSNSSDYSIVIPAYSTLKYELKLEKILKLYP